MTDKQCSSCGGFCGRGGCKRENVKPELENCDETYAAFLIGLHAAKKRKPLTDEEIQKLRYLIDWTNVRSYIKFARAIERAHGIGEQ